MNEHARASELLPWLVNGRIEASESHWLNGHLDQCIQCRAELAAQRRIRAALTREPTVEFAPQSSFNRLWQRIEAEAAGPAVPPARSAATSTRRGTPSGTPIRGRVPGWVRVALAAQAAAILVLCGVLWLGPDLSGYRTVTEAPASGARGPVIKAIFSDQVRLADVKEILAGTGLVVIAGPSEAGVYALAPRDADPKNQVPSAVIRLRTDPRVRFAEVGAQ